MGAIPLRFVPSSFWEAIQILSGEADPEDYFRLTCRNLYMY